ncbi:MAG: protein phosphatase 2C domain-containing protein [Flavobacteriaceae bacterium]|nr:protein phosphatase 2C domain-containing protein [Flavobacteriaceae bacterium]
MKIFKHHHIGKRPYQEDAMGHHQNAFVVCDGVGGHGNGDVASKTVLDFILSNSSQKALESIQDISVLIENANRKLNELLIENPEKERMGTTLAGIFKVKDAWFSVHIGDSRIYAIRPQEKVFWHTWDHSFVANLVKMGEISRETARKHPRSNEIQKAILANGAGNATKPEIQPLGNLKTGDLILICSDGVTEAWPDEALIALLCDTSISTEEKANTVFNQSSTQASDNNTAYLLEVTPDDVVSAKENQPDMSWQTLNSLTTVTHSPPPMLDKKKPWWKVFSK